MFRRLTGAQTWSNISGKLQKSHLLLLMSVWFSSNVGKMVNIGHSYSFFFGNSTSKLFSDFKVLMLQNEKIVESQPACGDRVCTLAQFSEAYRYLAQLNFDDECRL